MIKIEITGRLAFYIGIFCIILAALCYPMDWSAKGLTPMKFITIANTWFLIAMVILLNNISHNLSGKK